MLHETINSRKSSAQAHFVRTLIFPFREIFRRARLKQTFHESMLLSTIPKGVVDIEWYFIVTRLPLAHVHRIIVYKGGVIQMYVLGFK